MHGSASSSYDSLYTNLVSQLESRGVFPNKYRLPTLKPTQEGLEKIGYFESPFYQNTFLKDPYRVILVAGTNGKGSVCASLEALFQATGERVGLYTSPHLVDTTERIRVNDQRISSEDFCRVYEFIQRKIPGESLSHFEMLTLMAMVYFTSGLQIPPVDRIILEVGMGGTWDATNAIPHGVSVITKMGFDHEQYLGTKLLEILENKLGIIPSQITPDIPHPLVVHFPFPEEGASLVEQRKKLNPRAQWIESPLYPHHIEINSASDEPTPFLHSPWGKLPLALVGKRGAENTSLALSVFAALHPSPRDFVKALEHVRWPGRMQRFYLPDGPRIYLSGDHNPQGIESLLELLPHYPRKHLHILFGCGADKNLLGMLRPLLTMEQVSLYVSQAHFKGRPLEDYQSFSAIKGQWEDPETALSEILQRCGKDEMILVTGSLYLVGDILKSLIKRSASTKRSPVALDFQRKPWHPIENSGNSLRNQEGVDHGKSDAFY